MIPLQIKLRNFLSYGGQVQTINFEPYRLICLSGKNGHGKSALLDAITWALWGHARKTLTSAKSDEGLLRLGQTHMMVTFDFMYNAQQYRVQREFVLQNGKSHTELHFGTLNQQGMFNALNEKTTRATQQKIIDTLQLDYECCINSIFLRQGQSNEFSSKSAKERKEILITILGINHYETLRSKALEKSKEQELAQAQLSHIITHLKERVLQKPALLTQQDEINKNVTTATHQEELLKQQFDEQTKKNAQLLERSQHHIRAEQEHKNIQENVSTTLESLRNEKTALRALRRQQNLLTHILSTNEQKKIDAEYQQCEKMRQELYTHKESLLTASTKHAQLTQEITIAYHKELSLKAAVTQKHELICATLHKQQEEQAQTLQAKKTALAALEKELHLIGQSELKLSEFIDQEEKKIQRKKQFYHTFIACGNRITQTIKELEQKRMLACADESPACPLCEQSISGSRKRFLQEKFIVEEQVMIHQKNRLARILPTLKTQLIEQHAGFVAVQKNLETVKECSAKKEIITNECAELSKHIEQIVITQKNAIKELQAAHALYTDFQKNQESFFAQHEEYVTTKKSVVELQEKIKTSPYNGPRHEELTKLMHMIRDHEKNAAHYEQQKADYEHHKKNFVLYCTQARALKKQLQTSLQNLEQFKTLADEQIHHTRNGAFLEEQRTKNNALRIELLQKKSGVEQQIKTIEQHEQELLEYAKKIQNYETERDDYTTIAQALGKNGIQALLIETAIPELEYEANAILSKLTDNQSHIIIESVRDLKSGGFKETLDIKISDAVGTRSYELFSGGEAFRIDFALRIALSKLLARRAGTSLQTLIIDEGFGSQDEEGLSRIMEALYKIQDDFAKIIIVSHLPEMKNQFPTHFFVHKSSTGSQITVFEQG